MINLLPPQKRAEIRYGRKNAQILRWFSGFLFGVIALLAVAFIGRMTIQTSKEQALVQKLSIEEQLKSPEFVQAEKEYADFINGTDSVGKIYGRQVLYSRLIRKIATLLPPGARLSNISLSDTDKAINLNFVNRKEDLGPTLQINLVNQGEEIAERGRQLTEVSFGMTVSNISVSNELSIGADKRQISFDIDGSDAAKLDTFSKALKNGGEYAHLIIEPSLRRVQLFDKSSPVYIDSYKVNSVGKYVDYDVRAGSLNEAWEVAAYIGDKPLDTYIEVYAFENRNYSFTEKCSVNGQATCFVECESGGSDCQLSEKKCTPLDRAGCRFTVRAYYDELYTSASISALTESQKTKCESGKVCTHRVTATNSQLFSKVDIIRVATCTSDNDGNLECPVDIRAEFSPDSTFYLASSSGGGAQ